LGVCPRDGVVLGREGKRVQVAGVILASVLAAPAKLPAAPPAPEKPSPNQSGLNIDDPFNELKGPLAPSEPASSQQTPRIQAREPHATPLLTTDKDISTKPESRSETQQSSPLHNFVALFSTLSAIAAYGIFFRQLKQGKTPGNLPAAIMYTVNDSALFVAALLTPGQGITTRIAYGIFSGFGVLVSRELLKTRPREESTEDQPRSLWRSFDATEKRCTIAASTGIVLMLASNLPFVASTVPQSSLALVGAGLGITVSALSSIPLIKTMLKRDLQPTTDEPTSEPTRIPLSQRLWETAGPVVPYALGTVTLLLSALTVDKFSFGTLLSPVGMTLTNIALTTSVGIWAWRRSGEPRRNSDESRTEPKGE
jgi:hypothetical protein